MSGEPMKEMVVQAWSNIPNRLPLFFKVTVKRLLWTKRSIALNAMIFFLFLLQIGLQAYMDAESISSDTYVESIMNVYLSVAPFGFPFLMISALIYASLLLTEDREDKTIEYILTKPITKLEVIFYKFIPYVAVTMTIISVQLILIYSFIIGTGPGWGSYGEHIGLLGTFLMVSFLGILAYGALFMTIGVLFPRPLLYGFLIGLVWEFLLALTPGMAIQLFSIRHYLVNLLSYHLPGRFFTDNLLFNVEETWFPTGSGQAVMMLIVITAILFVVGWRSFRRVDFA